MKKFLNRLPNSMILPIFIVGGLLAGLVIYAFYMSRAHSYLSDDPSACVNCHIMATYYQSWNHSSHAQWATCNDCHVPQDNIFRAYGFKAMDGFLHSAVFTVRSEPQVIRPRLASSNVIMENCIRCHTQLNTEFVNTGMITFTQAEAGQGKACWDCHTQVPHTSVSNLNSSPGAIVPLPESPVPDWLKKAMNKNDKK